MLRIDAVLNGKSFTFRSNEGGEYLFVGVAENRQISCESGFRSLRKFKKAVREYVRDAVTTLDGKRIAYTVHSSPHWTA